MASLLVEAQMPTDQFADLATHSLSLNQMNHHLHGQPAGIVAANVRRSLDRNFAGRAAMTAAHPQWNQRICRAVDTLSRVLGTAP